MRVSMLSMVKVGKCSPSVAWKRPVAECRQTLQNY